MKREIVSATGVKCDGRFVRLAGGRWGVKLNRPRPVGAAVKIRLASGQVAECAVTSVPHEFSVIARVDRRGPREVPTLSRQRLAGRPVWNRGWCVQVDGQAAIGDEVAIDYSSGRRETQIVALVVNHGDDWSLVRTVRISRK